MAHVRVIIQTGRYPDSKYDFDQVFELSEQIIEDCFSPVDMPSESADIFSKLLCSSSEEIERVKRLRKNYAAMIADPIINAFKKAMSKCDKVMGYDKDELCKGEKYWEIFSDNA